MLQQDERLLRRPEVLRITGMTRYMVDMLEELGCFPKRVRIGQRAVFWPKTEIDAFIETQKQCRDHDQAGQNSL
jgi:predicted DNA-binding transcriptional regulator AlpA